MAYFSHDRISGLNIRSHCDYEPHSMTTEALETLRHPWCTFKVPTVGTITPLDNSEEKLNYDQMIEDMIFEKQSKPSVGACSRMRVEFCMLWKPILEAIMNAIKNVLPFVLICMSTSL